MRVPSPKAASPAGHSPAIVSSERFAGHGGGIVLLLGKGEGPAPTKIAPQVPPEKRRDGKRNTTPGFLCLFATRQNAPKALSRRAPPAQFLWRNCPFFRPKSFIPQGKPRKGTEGKRKDLSSRAEPQKGRVRSPRSPNTQGDV